MISIVVPAHNEESYIGRTLDSIAGQKFKDKEIIVVCDNCSDRTFNVANGKADRVFNVKLKNAPAARNFGASKASGDILIFLDADTRIVSKKFLERVGREGGHFIGTSFFLPDNKSLKYLLFCFGRNLASLFGMANGVLIVDKKSFDNAKGFNEKLFLAENGDLIKRVNSRFRHIPAFVETSMRRHESVGLFGGARFWLGTVFKKKIEDYGAVR